MTELSEEEKQKRVELEQFEKDQRNIQSELAEIARKAQQSNNGGSPSGLMSTQGFIWPVGRNFRINTGYPFGAVTSSGGRHTGVDFSGSGINGTPIYAVADGIVSISRAQMSGGKYVSYGEYIVIDHGRDTNGNIIFTLYAHGIAGSRQVSAGDRVTQGQRIMSVGSTGNSTGPHLHFEVLVNGSPVNPVSYLP
jgi:murein DD-endopeptidase MepM/ murein hydrolase activator NlpD